MNNCGQTVCLCKGLNLFRPFDPFFILNRPDSIKLVAENDAEFVRLEPFIDAVQEYFHAEG